MGGGRSSLISSLNPMSRIALSDTGDWQLVNDGQDIRGYQVVDENGQPVGTVATMLVDTDSELVTTLVLDNGTEVPTAEVTIGENVVYLGTALEGAGLEGAEIREGVTVFDDGGRVVRRESSADMEDFDTYADDFRTHHTATYGPAGRAYDDDLGAYRYGYTAAHGDTYRNRAYMDAENDLRTDYTAGRDFDADREAVRYGYDRAQRRRS